MWSENNKRKRKKEYEWDTRVSTKKEGGKGISMEKDEVVESFSGLGAFSLFYQRWSHPIGEGARS